MYKLKEKIIENKYFVLLLFSYFCVNLLICLFGRNQIMLSSDEYNILGTASWISKDFTSLDWTGFISQNYRYKFGSALLYLPAFIFKDGVLIYKTCLIINCLLACLTITLVYDLAKKLGQSKIKSCFLTLIAGTYPAFMLYTKLVWSETCLYLIVWGLLWLGYQLITKPRVLSTVTFSIVLGLSLWVHNRSYVLAATVLFLLLINGKRLLKNWKLLVLGAIVFCSVFTLGDKLDGIVSGAVYTTDSSRNTVNAFVNSAETSMSAKEDIGILVLQFVGQLFYLTFSTFGLVLFFSLFAIKTFIRRDEVSLQEKTILIGLMFGVILTAIVGILNNDIAEIKAGSAADYFLYGRYTSIFVSPLLLFGFALYDRSAEKSKTLGEIALAILAVFATVVPFMLHPWLVGTTTTPLFYSLNVVDFNWIGLLNYNKVTPNLMQISIVGFWISVLCLGSLNRGKGRTQFIAFCLALNVFGSSYVLFNYPDVFVNDYEIDSHNAEKIELIQKTDYKDVYILNASETINPRFMNYQLYYPTVNFHRFSDDALSEGLAEEGLLVVPQRTVVSEWERLVDLSGDYDYWVRGEELTEQLKSVGAEFK